MSSPTPSQTPAPAEILKHMADTYRQIFHAYIAAHEEDAVLKFEPIEGKQRVPGFARDGQDTQIILTHFGKKNEDSAVEDGCPIVPRGTDPQLKWAFSKWNLCDFAGLSFIGAFQSRLKEKLPGATVEWLRVSIVPKYLFRDAGTEPHTHDPLHSAFLIALPDGGGNYVVDFTIEQFGLDESFWFSTEEEYRGLVVPDEWWIDSWKAKFVELVDEEEMRQDTIVRMKALQKVWQHLDWEELDKMSPEDRSEYLVKKTREALDEMPDYWEGEVPVQIHRAYA